MTRTRTTSGGTTATADVRALISALTVEQLKRVIGMVGGRRTRAQGAPTNRDDVEAELLAVGKRDAVRSALYRVEAESPSPHCVLLPMSAAPSVLPDKTDPPSLGCRLAWIDRDEATSTLTFEFTVNSYAWKLSADGRKKVSKLTRLRHPKVVRIFHEKKFCIISYPGYNQGQPPTKSERHTYEDLLRTLTKKLGGYGFQFDSFPAKTCVDRLSDAGAKRFVTVGTRAQLATGKLALSSWDNAKGIHRLLAAEISPQLPGISRKDLEDAIAGTLKKAAANAMVLVWQPEGVLTRLEFWQTATEFLFVWRESAQTWRVVEGILESLWSTMRATRTAEQDRLWAEVADALPGSIFTVSDWNARFRLSPDETGALLTTGLTSGLFEPVYRVLPPEGDEVLEGNPWTSNLVSLRRTFTLSTGEPVDGANPENIAVGFRRTAKS